MKKKNIKLALLMIGLLLFYSFEATGQERNWHDSLIKLLKQGQRIKIEAFSRLDKFPAKEKVRKLAIHNINTHFREVAKLRISGKSEEDIRAYFNSRRIAVGTGSISGMVYESDDETPIQYYVSVWAFNEYGQYSGYEGIYPEGNGAYAITELSTDKYYVRTESYGLYGNEYYDDVTDWRDATLVPVTDGQETSGINFTLGSSKDTGAITGQVSSVDGTPLKDCYFLAYDEDYNLVSYGLTDESGLYEVSGLASGGYKLEAYYEGTENYVGEWYDDAQSFEMATVVTVTAPNTTEDINFILDYAGAIEGRFFDATGEPVGENDCYIIACDTEENWISGALTDENGNFALARLRTGVYRLCYYYYGQKNYLDGWYDGADDFDTATPVAVTAPETTYNVHITLPAGGAISGTVLDYNGQPLAFNCDVMVYDEHQNQVGMWGYVGENGNYTILRLPTGRYKIYAKYWVYNPTVGEEPVSEWYDGKYKFEDAKFVEVTAPYTTENIDFTLIRGGFIQGQVYDPEGQLLSYSGEVIAYNLQGDLVGSRSVLNDGLYFITGLATQDYKLRFFYYGEENYENEWYNGKQSFETADSVHVSAPNMTPDINFTLEYPGILTMRTAVNILALITILS